MFRKIPYPYRAMLAICSDLDETPDADIYLTISRFLNSRDETPMGPGVGLEVGNTLYFDMPEDQFSYWNTDDAGREMVHTLIHSGHIDCFHSYGDFATTRAHAERALEALDRHGCRLESWVDHAQAPSNFGADIMEGRGDVPGDPVYHADLTCAAGVRYVWRGRVTSIIGQNSPRRYGGIANWSEPVASLKTLAKEFVKGMLGRLGDEKYAMHPANRVMVPATLRDGRKVWEFFRFSPYWGGVARSDTADGVKNLVNRQVLDTLVKRQGISILYTHLGKITDHQRPFNDETVAAFRLLAGYVERGEILMATTTRLLGYCEMVESATVERRRGEQGEEQIHIAASLPRRRLDGVTLYVDRPEATRLFYNGEEVGDLQGNPPDESGRPSVSVPWRSIDFPL